MTIVKSLCSNSKFKIQNSKLKTTELDELVIAAQELGQKLEYFGQESQKVAEKWQSKAEAKRPIQTAENQQYNSI
jgi:hypothetical protein